MEPVVAVDGLDSLPSLLSLTSRGAGELQVQVKVTLTEGQPPNKGRILKGPDKRSIKILADH